MIAVKCSLALFRTAFMELSPSLMALDPDVSDPERGTTVGHEKKVGATNHVVEIVMMTIIGKEAVKERGIVIATEIATGNETERENIVIVKEAEGRGTASKTRYVLQGKMLVQQFASCD